MYKLWRYYNQNKLKIWTFILIIVLGLAIIRTLNVKLKDKKIQSNDKETTSNVVSYHNESQSMVSGGSISEVYRDDFGKFINQFFTFCIEHDPQTAYSMLSNDTKQELYQTEELFEKNYYESKFTGNKQFSFQSWSSDNNLYVYQVKIFDNMLATGKTNDNYIEEYVTISLENGEYKLNLNSYLGRTIINKKTEDDKLVVQVVRVDTYLDYEIYTLNIQNKLNENILLDTRRKTNTCYVTDKLDNKFEALLYENKEDDLKFSPNEVKTIQIKFSDARRENLQIKSINFTDIVKALEYSDNTNIKGDTFKANV